MLQKIAEQHPELRTQVIAILSEILEDAEHDYEQAVTGAMSALIELKAAETLPLIRRAFELGKIDETMYGPWGEVLKELGGTPAPDDPLIVESQQRFKTRHSQMFPPGLRENLDAFQEHQRTEHARVARRELAQKRKQAQERRQKNTRKIASAARKANRKKQH